LAADDAFVYAALRTNEGGIGFCRLAINDGKEVTFTRKENGKSISEVDHVCNPKPAIKGKTPSWIELYDRKGWNAATVAGTLRGCAVDENRVFISSYWDDAIYVCDKKTAADIKTITLPRPAGLATGPDGNLFAITDDNAVVLINVESETVTPVIAAGLSAPLGLTVDSAGSFYVSQRGAAMNVKVFNRAGKLIREIGKPGGRAVTGPYTPDGMLMPRGVAVDRTGRTWVVEEDFAPRRISVWKASGELDREFVGGSTYAATGGAVNPDDPTMAIDTGTIFALDWKQGSYKPVYSLPRIGWCRGAVFGWPYPGDGAAPHGKARFLGHEGRQFLLRENNPMQVLEVVDGRWLPRAALGSVHGAICGPWRGKSMLDLSVMPGYDRSTWVMKWPPPRDLKNYFFVWCDLNGDGLVQTEEVETTPSVEGVSWSWSHGRFRDDLTAQLGYSHITPSGKTACGAPLYRFDDLKPSVQLPETHPNGWGTWLSTPKGWLIASGFSRAWKDTPTSKITGLMGGYDPKGERKWFYPSYFHTHGSLGAPAPQRGLFVGDWYYGGIVDFGGDLGEVFHVAGNLGQHYLFTTDGLYISELFRDARSGPVTPAEARRGMSLDDMTNGPEGWLAGFFKNPDDGHTYVLSSIGNNHKNSGPVISKVSGLDTVKRLQGTLTVTERQTARARENPPVGTGGTRQSGGAIAKSAQPPVIDGSLDDWDFTQAFGIPVDDKRGARVALRYDAVNLYLAYDVRDPFPLRNSGVDPLMLFKTGTAVDLMLATDPEVSSVSRSKPVKGDLRLLLSVMGDKPVAVLYRPVAPGATDGNSFSSPNVRIVFDSVRVQPEARIAFQRRKDGFTLEAVVPLEPLGWLPTPKSALMGDVGVIYADEDGKNNILRSYWSNKNTNLTADVGLESRLTPAQWGKIVVSP